MKLNKLAAVLCACVLGVTLMFTGCQNQTYKPPAKEQTVEASALGKAGVLRVGVNASSAPLAGKTPSSTKIVGIDVDVAAYLADQLGVKVEIVDVGNDPVSALSGGNVDMVLGVDASEAEAEYWRSKSYLATGVALFGAKNNTTVPTIESKPKIAAQASSRSSWRVTNLFGDDSLVVQSDLKNAFEALAQSQVQYVAADAIIGTYVSFSNGYADQIVALLQSPNGYCAAISKNNTALQAAIDAAMDTLVEGGMMEIIEKQWLGSVINIDGLQVIKPAVVETPKVDGENAEGAGAEGSGDTDASGADGAQGAASAGAANTNVNADVEKELSGGGQPSVIQ